MEATNPEKIQVREVTQYQPTWTAKEPGQPGVFTIQLILDHGAEEFIIQPDADDADVLVELLERGENVYFDVGRRVLMFGNRAIRG